MKLTHGDPRIMVLFDEDGEALATCVSIEARDRLIEAVNGADAKLADAKDEIRWLRMGE